MARISKYEQGQLASQVVGTPGVDSSGYTALNKVGSAFQDVANNLAYSAHLKQQQVDAAAKQLRNLEIGAKVGAANVQYGVALNKIDNETRTATEFDTTNTVPTFTTKANEAASALLDGVTDPVEKLMLEQKLQETAGRYQTAIGDWTQTRRKPIMEANVGKSVSALEQSAAEAPTVDDFGKAVGLWSKDMDATYAALYGPEAGAKKREDVTKAVKSRLNAVVQKPEVTDEMFEEEFRQLQKLADPKDLAPEYNTWKALVRERQAEEDKVARANKRDAQLEATLEVIQSSPEGDAALMSEGQAQDLKKRGVIDKLTPAQQAAFERARKNSEQAKAANAAKQKRLDKLAADAKSDPLIAKTVSDTALPLAGKISALNKQIVEYRTSGQANEKTTAKMLTEAGQLAKQVASLEQLGATITDPSTRAQLLSKVKAARDEMQSLLSKVKIPPKELAARTAVENNIYAGEAKAGGGSPYAASSKEYARYQFFYKQEVDAGIEAAKANKMGELLYRNGKVKTSNGKTMPYWDALHASARQKAIQRVEMDR